MSLYMEFQGMREAYPQVCKKVLQEGSRVSPRGELTHEVLDAVLVVHDPSDALPIGVGRNLNVSIGVAEAAQLVAGKSYPRLMTRIAPSFARYTDGGIFHGAYGPRTAAQLPAVKERLKYDADTRQAIVTLWDPARDLHGTAKDLPCTVMMQFLIRSKKLILHVTMRSNDVWLGLPYDVFQFTQLQLAMAHALQVEAGDYRHHAVSMHAYQRDWDQIEQLHACDTEPYYALGLGIGRGCKTWAGVQDRATQVLEGGPFNKSCKCETAMREVLLPHREVHDATKR